MKETKQLVSARKMAPMLDVKPATVKIWALAGRIPSVRISSRCIRFDPVAVLEAVQHQPEG